MLFTTLYFEQVNPFTSLAKTCSKSFSQSLLPSQILYNVYKFVKSSNLELLTDS